jgi:hypothetical protein
MNFMLTARLSRRIIERSTPHSNWQRSGKRLPHCGGTIYCVAFYGTSAFGQHEQAYLLARA